MHVGIAGVHPGREGRARLDSTSPSPWSVSCAWLSSDHPEASRKKSSKLLLPRYGPGAVPCPHASFCAPIAHTAPPPECMAQEDKAVP